MTNAEINLKSAIEAMNAGKLTSYEVGFIQQIKYYNKKGLKSLTAKEYDLLRSIAAKK